MYEISKLKRVASFDQYHYPVEIVGGMKFVTVPEWFVTQSVESAKYILKIEQISNKTMAIPATEVEIIIAPIKNA